MTNAINYINTLNPKQVEAIQQSLNELKRDVKEGVTKIRKIETYLYNDNETSSVGLVQQVRQHEDRLDKIEEESTVRKRVFATLGIIGGAVGMALVELIKYLLSNHKA